MGTSILRNLKEHHRDRRDQQLNRVAVESAEAAIAGDGIGERRVGSVHPGLVQSQGAQGPWAHPGRAQMYLRKGWVSMVIILASYTSLGCEIDNSLLSSREFFGLDFVTTGTVLADPLSWNLPPQLADVHLKNSTTLW